jgi:hypothetical protein
VAASGETGGGEHRNGMGNRGPASGVRMGSATAPDKASDGKHRPGVVSGGLAINLRVAASPHAGHHSVTPMESLPRTKIKGAGGELSVLMRGMMNAQANDSGWPTFSGKYVPYP